MTRGKGGGGPKPSFGKEEASGRKRSWRRSLEARRGGPPILLVNARAQHSHFGTPVPCTDHPPRHPQFRAIRIAAAGKPPIPEPPSVGIRPYPPATPVPEVQGAKCEPSNPRPPCASVCDSDGEVQWKWIFLGPHGRVSAE